MNQQPLASPLVCLEDGHNGIWNLFEQIEPPSKLAILDWYHLVENLGKVGGSQKRLDAVEARLWHGDVEGALKRFDDWPMGGSSDLLPILPSIVIASSTTATTRLKGLQLAWAKLNRWSSRLADGSKSPGLSGTQTTCSRFSCIAVFISMASSQLSICKTGMHSGIMYIARRVCSGCLGSSTAFSAQDVIMLILD